MQNKNHLILVNTLSYGGIETFVLRISQQFVGIGDKVTVVVLTRNFSPEIVSEISGIAKIVFLDQFLDIGALKISKLPIFFSVFSINRKKLRVFFDQEYDHIHATDSITLIYANLVKKFFQNAILTCGIYHIGEFMYDVSPRLRLSFWMNNLFKKSLDTRNIIYYNEYCEEVYRRVYHFEKSNNIFPIGVDLANWDFLPDRNVKKLKIVTVGRLVDFKTYHFFMLDIVQEVLSMGINVNYVIYGDGPLRSTLEKRVVELGISNTVQFKGAVRYDTIKTLIRDSCIFVGSGTALVEAAALGIPALAMIDGADLPITYGYIHEISGISFQEKATGQKEFSIKEKLLNVLKLSDLEYFEICKKSRAKAESLSIKITLRKFIELLDKKIDSGTVFEQYKMFELLFLVFIDLLQFNKKLSNIYNSRYKNTKIL